eukprot:3051272-Rhodomonas_salina.1
MYPTTRPPAPFPFALAPSPLSPPLPGSQVRSVQRYSTVRAQLSAPGQEHRRVDENGCVATPNTRLRTPNAIALPPAFPVSALRNQMRRHTLLVQATCAEIVRFGFYFFVGGGLGGEGLRVWDAASANVSDCTFRYNG